MSEENITAGDDLGLTPKQAALVRAVAHDGLTLVKAAEVAGYAHAETAGRNVARLPHVRAAIVAARQVAIEGDLASLGLRTMRALMTDELTPAPVRFQAAKWSLEAAGHAAAARSAGLPAADRPLAEMSLSELEDFIKRGEDALGNIKKINVLTIESPAVPVV